MRDERDIVEAARAGSDTAWRDLYDRHCDLVFRVAVRMLNDREAALDVLQDTFVRASGSISEFRGEASIRSWLVSIALNQARSVLRSRARCREVPMDGVAEPECERRPPDRVAADRDLVDRVLALVARLPDLQRNVLLLRVTEGLPYREIAEALETSEGSARVSYHHGIRRLREQLGGLLNVSAPARVVSSEGGRSVENHTMGTVQRGARR